MQIIDTKLSGVKRIIPKVFGDSRGFFFETFQAERYQPLLGNLVFVQDNLSRSTQGVLRGLHYQLPYSQGKLVWVTRGEVLDVVVDIRHGSPTFGQVETFILNDENHEQVYIPPGLAHGFCVLSDVADFYYKCTDYYQPSAERGVIWNDPDLAIEWPVKNPILSPKDEVYSRLKDIPKDQLPIFKEPL